jgi:hypothetical protein
LQDILSNIIVIVALGLLGGAIFLFVRHKQAAAKRQLEQMALEHGWRLETIREPLAWGVRISSQAWTLEALSKSSDTEAGPGSSNVAMSTRWQADRPGSILIFGPRHPGAPVTPDFARLLLKKFSGADLTEVPLNDPALQERYMLWAQIPAEAQAWQAPALAAALMEWKGPLPLVKRDRSGLQMEINGVRLKSPGELLNFIRIGETLLDVTPGHPGKSKQEEYT